MAAVALRHDALVWFFCFCFPRVVRAASAIISRAGLLHSLFVLFFHHFSFSFFFFLVYRAPLYFCYDFGFFFQNIFCCLRWPPPRWAPRGSFRLLVDFGFLWSRTRDRYGIWKFGRPRGAWIGCLEISSFKEKKEARVRFYYGVTSWSDRRLAFAVDSTGASGYRFGTSTTIVQTLNWITICSLNCFFTGFYYTLPVFI